MTRPGVCQGRGFLNLLLRNQVSNTRFRSATGDGMDEMILNMVVRCFGFPPGYMKTISSGMPNIKELTRTNLSPEGGVI